MCHALNELSRTDLEYLIREWIHDERDRRVVSRRLLDGIVYERLAEEFDLSVQQVKTIVYKSQNRLLKHI
jgi:DNA-directed RNA polymerase specialized sigma24 family protein